MGHEPLADAILTPAQKAARTRKQKAEVERRERQEITDAAKNADAIYERIKRGDHLRVASGGGTFFWKDNSEASRWAVRRLFAQKRAKRSGDFVLLSSPEEYAAKQAEQDRQRSANRRRRLDRWTKAIADAAGVTIDPGKIDEPLLAIAREMECGMMDDE